jgi:F0F1-type ATP synthase membrane subunit a
MRPVPASLRLTNEIAAGQTVTVLCATLPCATVLSVTVETVIGLCVMRRQRDAMEPCQFGR